MVIKMNEISLFTPNNELVIDGILNEWIVNPIILEFP